MQLSGLDIQQATGGSWHGSVPEKLKLHHIATDTRDFHSGDAFLALRGPSFDGHAFAATIAHQASALIGDRNGMQTWSSLDNAILEVDDTLQAFGDIAHAWRQRLTHTTVIAISGSYGKTSLRSLLETGFSALAYSVSATHANLNNLIGVPQTLLAIPHDTDIAIIECGISEVGEMTRLAAMVEPDIAILTGLTAAHSEGLGNMSGIVHEKVLLLQDCNWCGLGSGVAELLAANHIQAAQNWLSVDDNHGMDTVQWTLHGCDVQFSYQHQQAQMSLALPAAHWAANLAFAATIMLRHMHSSNQQANDDKDVFPLTSSLQRVISALSHWQPQAGRMHIYAGMHDCVLLDDSYNANPASMQAALDTLRGIEAKRIAILGDMAELGDMSEAAHADIPLHDLDHVYLIGQHMHALADRHPNSDWFADTQSAITALRKVSFAATDHILIKASRSMHLEQIVDLLRQPEVAHAV